MFGSNIADHGVFHLASLLSSQSPGAVMPTPRVTFHRIAVIALLLIMAGTILHTIHGESLTWDEGDHIFSGYEIWKTHDYGYNPEHPPIVKMDAPLRVDMLDRDKLAVGRTEAALAAIGLKQQTILGRHLDSLALVDSKRLRLLTR